MIAGRLSGELDASINSYIETFSLMKKDLPQITLTQKQFDVFTLCHRPDSNGDYYYKNIKIVTL